MAAAAVVGYWHQLEMAIEQAKKQPILRMYLLPSAVPLQPFEIT